MHICFLNIRLTHAQLKSDHSTTVYVKAAQTLLSDIWLTPLFTLLCSQVQIFNYDTSIVFHIFGSACKPLKICILIATWITEYFSQRCNLGSQKASSKWKQQYLMSKEMPEKNVMCKEAFLLFLYLAFWMWWYCDMTDTVSGFEWSRSP